MKIAIAIVINNSDNIVVEVDGMEGPPPPSVSSGCLLAEPARPRQAAAEERAVFIWC